MQKETLTLDAIKKDLMIILKQQKSHKTEWRLLYIIPITLLAVMFGILLQNVVPGALIFSTSGYQIYRYAKERKEFSAKKKELLNACERQEISISVLKFSHASEEFVYEPHYSLHHRRSHTLKLIRVYYFENGAFWRLPRLDTHYAWSKEFYLSDQGLKNLSAKDSEFFFVRLQSQQDIAYIYPCLMFRLAPNLQTPLA